MSRKLPKGTPDRTHEYVHPEDSRGRWLLGGLVVGVALLVLLVGGYFLGASRTLSPGPVMAAHAPFEGECIQCHAVGGQVEEVRCQRCHDAEMTDRLSHGAHVLSGSGDRRKAAAAERLECMTCHVEHRGRQVSLAGIEDRECAACHDFASLDAHPEFAAAAAGVQTGVGLQYNHRIHFEHEDSRIESCDACHRPTPDLGSFEPISFDLHCAGPCHTHQREDGSVSQPYRVAASAILVPRPDRLPPPYGGGSLAVEDFLNLVELAGVTHAEPWLVEAADALSRVIDPAGYRARRAALQQQVEWLRERFQVPPVGDVPSEVLRDWLERLGRQLDELTTRRAQRQDEPDEAALQRSRRLVEEIGGRIAAADSRFAEAWENRERVEATGEGESRAESAADAHQERRQELADLVEAVVGRAAGADERLADEAAALRGRITELSPAAGGTLDEEGREALRARLDDLDEALRVVSRTEDPAARRRAAEIRTLQELARARLAEGLPRSAFERRRAELAPLLDVMRASPDSGVAFAAEGLRQDLLRVRPRSPVLDEARLESTRALVERLELEIELRREGVAARRLGLGSFRDRTAIRRQLESLSDRLEGGRLPIDAGAAEAADPGALREGLQALLAPCLKCHTTTGPRLSEVQVAEPVYRRAEFDHAPHVTVASCEDCHGRPPEGDEPGSGVWVSDAARELNTPGVDNCRSCHTPSWAGDDCELCHVYHPPGIERLLTR